MPFQKRGNSTGGWKGGGSKSFGAKKSWDRGGDRGFDKPEMHRATCAACNEACQVPFKPNGSRPVYCSNCFGREEDRGAKPFKPSFERAGGNFSIENKNTDKLKDQLNILNSKLDILINALVKTASAEVDEDADAIDKVVSKKKK